MELIYIKNGTLHLTINNHSYTGKKGDIFLINTEDLHEMHTEEKDIFYYAFLFSMSQFSVDTNDYVEHTYITPIINKSLLFEHKLSDQSTVRNSLIPLLEQLVEINHLESTAYQLGTKALLLQVIYLLIQDDFVKKSWTRSEKSEKIQLQKNIVHYIRTNCTERISLSHISFEFSMTPKYFCKYFKLTFNKTFVEYLNYIRMELAMELLVTTDLSITEIASSCGFDNFSYFIRRFKSLTGSTPSNYRKSGKAVLTFIG
jgi:AraC-like DNA-binding protein